MSYNVKKENEFTVNYKENLNFKIMKNIKKIIATIKETIKNIIAWVRIPSNVVGQMF